MKCFILFFILCFQTLMSIHTCGHLNLATKFSVVKVKCSLMKTIKFLWFGGFFFNWSIGDLQCCVRFWCTTNWFGYTHIFFFRFFFIIGYSNMLNIIPCAIQQDLVVYLFYIKAIYQALNLSSPTHFPFGNHKFVFYVCESLSVL